MEPRRIPVFATEAEEARWWYDHRDELAEDFTAARLAGRLGEGSRARFERLNADQPPTQDQHEAVRQSTK